MGAYRTISISTKMLHPERRRLIPILDSYVVSMLNARAGDAAQTAALVLTLREEGKENLATLNEISRRLSSIGIDRTLVRILDALLWSGFQKESPEAEFGRGLVQWHRGRLFF